MVQTSVAQAGGNVAASCAAVPAGGAVQRPGAGQRRRRRRFSAASIVVEPVNRESQRGRAQQQRSGGAACRRRRSAWRRWRRDVLAAAGADNVAAAVVAVARGAVAVEVGDDRDWFPRSLAGARPVHRACSARPLHRHRRRCPQAHAPKQAPQLKGFPTPEAAADALTEAIRKQDDKAITAILGVDWHTLDTRQRLARTTNLRDQFLKAWDESHTIIQETPDKALVGAGKTGWVSPIPIVRQANEWRYDVEAGRVELEARLIGRDEFAVIQTLLAIVDAQRDYASLDPMKLGVPVYARRLVSSPGLKNGTLLGDQAGRAAQPAGSLARQGAVR